jgi:spore coat polysaccharide biosynthesis protein SpsF
MTTMVVMQARTGSSRLPGKVLAPVAGRSMLALQLERLASLPWPLVVATTVEGCDDEVARVADEHGHPVIRGDEHDVLGRFALAVQTHPADVVVRVTADCPLIDPGLVEAVVAARHRAGADYASNTLVRTFPDGLDAEAVTAEALLEAHGRATAPAEREHVTPAIWSHPDRYRIVQLVTDPPHALERWTVDTAEDLERVRALCGLVPDPRTATWTEFLTEAGPIRPQTAEVVSGVDPGQLTLTPLPRPVTTGGTP